ncbi:acyl-CoA desaturase [Nonomuraea salmonea]|uniref:acyl-CoA desaturase n=1 Tax=Nonomuraea salmonea TaxID=46181 RepID=UPI0031EFC097
MTVTETSRPGSGQRGSDYARLSRRIAQAGLLERRPGYYAARITLVAALFAGTWALFAALGDSWWQLAVAVLLAAAFGQVTLLAHDLAHGQIFRSRRTSRNAGLIVGNLAVGLSYGWWMDKHTRHHANPNHEDHDPDVSPDFLLWSERQAAASKGLPRFIGRYQAWLFFPLLTLEGVNLKVSSFRALRRPTLKNRAIEGALLGGHVLAYLGGRCCWCCRCPRRCCSSPCTRPATASTSAAPSPPNHKGMPVLTAEDELDFLRKQVLTSRNVRGGHLVTTALGGLNYQIEHHLFPSMPTANLRRARPIVRDHCASLGIDYVECGLLESWGQALRHLHEVGRPLRRVRT